MIAVHTIEDWWAYCNNCPSVRLYNEPASGTANQLRPNTNTAGGGNS